MISDTFTAARRDPFGALAAICIAVAAGLMAASMMDLLPSQPVLDRSGPERVGPGPAKWRAAAKPGDILDVPGYAVAYWGDPRAEYGRRVTRQRRRYAGIVVHFPVSQRLMASVLYGHTKDRSRGGASYGYHVYIGQEGQIVQGAPLSRRTNHVRDSGSSKRRPGIAAGHDSRDLIGITAVGACQRGTGPMCRAEVLTEAQRAAAIAVVRALQAKLNLPCDAIWGHGELQTNRTPFEGKTVATEIRMRCRQGPVMALGAGD